MSRQQLEAIVQLLRSQPVVKPDASVEEARAGFEQIAGMFPVDPDIRRDAPLRSHARRGPAGDRPRR